MKIITLKLNANLFYIKNKNMKIISLILKIV